MFVGSCLVELDLSHNSLVALELKAHTFLQTIDLSHNHLTDVRELAALKHCRSLNVSHNDLHSDEGLAPLQMLQTLNLGHNPNLAELRDAGTLGSLMSLDASHCESMSVLT